LLGLGDTASVQSLERLVVAAWASPLRSKVERLPFQRGLA
jgi:hypothetical protein